MSKLAIITRREYLQRVRKKGFVVMTLLLPALMAAYIAFVIHMARASGDVASHLAVVDLSGKLFAPLQQALNQKTLGSGQRKYTLEQVPAAPASLEQTRSALQQAVLRGDYTAYLIIPADVLAKRHAEYHARNVANFAEEQSLRDDLRQIVSRTQLLQLGVSGTELARVFSSFDLKSLKVAPEGEREDSGQTFALAYIVGILLYMSLLMYGVSVMRSVVEEKTSRVAEVMLASADPFDLLMGKILGVTAVGLTQYAVWGFFAALLGGYFLVTASLTGSNLNLPHITVGFILWVIVFFVLGCLVYASLYAAVGAIVSSDQEAQQTQLPITLLLVIAFVMAPLLLNDPSSATSVALSLVPFFAPILMTMRMAVADPPFWQMGLAVALCAVTLLLVVKGSAKIYRLGLLMTGKRPTLPELVRWLRYA